MFAHELVQLSRCIDPHLRPEGIVDHSQVETSIRRAPLQGVIDALSHILHVQNAPVPPVFAWRGVVRALGAVGKNHAHRERANPPHLRAEIRHALRALQSGTLGAQLLAVGLGALIDELDWYSGDGGPYASVNFDQGHSHAVLIGPGGLEERADVCFGITVMAPYTRFPDHEPTRSRLMLALSDAEFWSEGEDWSRVPIGASFAHTSGRLFAMRCGARPFLCLWSEPLSGR